MRSTPASRLRRPGALRTWLAVLCASLVASLATSAVASAEFGIEPGSFVADVSTLQAGAHPDARTAFRMNTRRVGFFDNPDGSVRDIVVDLPPGLVGDPTGIPQCDIALVTAEAALQGVTCPRDTMVGAATIDLLNAGIFPQRVTVPVFNLKPYADQPAAFGFNVGAFSTVRLDASVRSDGDYHLRVNLDGVSQLMNLISSDLVFWGVPADHNGPGPEPMNGVYDSYGGQGGGPRVPFMTNSAECGVPRSATIRVRSWEDPSTWLEYTSEPRTITGCEKLRFEPSLDMRPDSGRAGVPAAYAVDLVVPQTNDNPTGLATPPVKDVTVTLPQGVTVSPSSADGLQGCTDQQVGLGALGPPNCPNGSKIGTVSIDTPLLDVPLTGAVYLGQPKSNDSQTGEMLRIFITAQAVGVNVKLEGKITPDPVTGQVTAVFKNNPQLPFNLLRVRFQGGPRAPLTNPQTCGSYTTNATMTSWGGQSVNSSSTFEITQNANGGPCVNLGFSPGFNAGMNDPAGGKSSTFGLTFSRDDTQQDLRDITVAMPEGLTGVIANTAKCANAVASAGACGEASRIGNVTVGAGGGTNPFFLPGRVYLTESYGGGPFGLSIVVPAIAGPFDLGNVVVRAAIHVDRQSAALTVKADAMPTILQGIPLRVRTVNVRIDKPDFMLNPTNCRRQGVAAVIASAAGALANVSSRFKAADCAALPFRPKMTLRVGGRGLTRRNVRTALDATLEMPRGDANNRVVQVRLPKALNARLDVVNRACSLAEFQAGRCTEAAQLGTAIAVTPLLKDPLTGPVYFVRNPARRLPDVVAALRGEVSIDLVGKTSIPRDLSLRTTFDTVPDVPVTRFTMSFRSGRNGLIGAVENLCTARRARTRAGLRFRAQNGRLVIKNQNLRIEGCASRRASARRGSARGRSRGRGASAGKDKANRRR